MDLTPEPEIHIPVLFQELVEHIQVHDERQNVIVDATLGLAGHASEILKKMHPGDIFIGFDADSRNLSLARQRLEKIQTQLPAGIEILLVQNNFNALKQELQARSIPSISAIYYDLGVSSAHFDEPERGFSFRFDGPLDMRFDTSSGFTAADILSQASQKELEIILRDYGEEPRARQIAEKIVATRKQKPFETTTDLAEFLRNEIHPHKKILMRVFQALRIAVNNELENLESSLEQAIDVLEPGGDLFVISFHSLEDRIVKQTIQRETRDCLCNDVVCSCGHTKTLKKMTKKPIIPTKIEQEKNPRSRSAKARHAKKI